MNIFKYRNTACTTMEIQAQYTKILKTHSNVISIKNITFLILTTILVIASNSLMNSLGTVSAIDLAPTYDGTDLCAYCHETQYQEWNQTGHANAYRDPEFQEEWIQQGSPTSCLACHTTGLDKETGEFQFEGVICEVCHGAGTAMEPVSTAEICSTCHSFSPFPIYQEWLESEHSHADVDCIDCHEFHDLELKAEEPADLCASCHE
jgi:nitrate/TMAO reductase-like tetraheme cytochrome c subunit